MIDKSNYTLIDFGAGRKLESFGKVIVDRPCPAANKLSKRKPARWQSADLAFAIHDDRTWRKNSDGIDDWFFQWNQVRLQLAPSPFGHLGVFAEQQSNWHWMAKHSRLLTNKRILNLFAYTGGSTLVAAACGARVTHIDSARNIVNRAKRNAQASGLADRPIRWITEDALRFVLREAKRGNCYDGFILDPPSYGHGTRRESWKIERDLPELLSGLKAISSEQLSMILFTGHSVGVDRHRMLNLCKKILVRRFILNSIVGRCRYELLTGEHFPADTTFAPNHRLNRHRNDGVMKAITSSQNARLKAAIALHRNRERKRQGRIIVFGSREVNCALDSPLAIRELFVKEDSLDDPQAIKIISAAILADVETFRLTADLFDKLAYGDRNDGVVAVADRPRTHISSLSLVGPQVVVVLESIEKPGNIGAVIRTASAAGASAVLVADPVSDVFHPNAIRSAMGLSFSMKIAIDSSDAIFQWLSNNNMTIFASRVDGKEFHTSVEYPERTAIVFGNEARGLGDAWNDPAVHPVRIPMMGSIDSLNISVSAGIILYEVGRQRGTFLK